MFAKITNILIVTIVAASTTLVVATAGAAPLSAPSQAEINWMDRSSGPADGN